MKKYALVWIGLLLIMTIGSILFFRSEIFLASMAPVSDEDGQEVAILSTEYEGTGNTLRLYVVEGEDRMAEDFAGQLDYAARYSRIKLERASPGEIAGIEPDPYTGLLVSGTAINELDVPAIRRFAELGGRVFIANSFYFSKEWEELLGVETRGGYESFKGMTFNRELFPGYPDFPADTEAFTHSSIQVNLKDTADVWIEAEGNPVFWMNPVGEGKVGMWNSAILTGKMSRGLMIQSLSVLFPAFVSSQAGTEVVYIDDFPAPVPAGTLEGTNLLDQTVSVRDFYKHYWWPDIEAMMDKYGIKLTSGSIITYEDEVNGPFKNMEDSIRQPYVYYGRSLLRQGGEIGYHGYNHQPLVLKNTHVDPQLGYNYWPDENSMRRAVRELKGNVETFFPKQTIETYVPPSNIIDETGIRVLAEELPELRTIASLYIGSSQNGSLIQEFEYDGTYENVFHYPRVTSGYSLSLTDQFQMADVMAHVGIVSHFVHPDDVLDDYRSDGRTWKELSGDYEDLLKNVRTWYPQLKSVTQKEATAAMKAYLQSDVEATFSDGMISIACKGVPETASLLIRLEDGKGLKTGEFEEAEVLEAAEGLYSVRMKKPAAELEILEVER
ncbi:DUF2194 domain-containing protein [Bhargavaea ullalensis]|uniref:DUF2194 domain-containing protein n=1 Tax=Bhargavaea ullalensis TaxID=1265685 RepID=A0ABV2GE95_9BACL